MCVCVCAHVCEFVCVLVCAFKRVIEQVCVSVRACVCAFLRVSMFVGWGCVRMLFFASKVCVHVCSYVC